MSGENLQILADSSSPQPAAWAPDGTILFKPASVSPLFRVSASGGKAVPFAVLGANDYSDYNPAILPDGTHILVVVIDKQQQRHIEIKSLTSSESKLILDDADQPARLFWWISAVHQERKDIRATF